MRVCLAVTCHLHFWQNDRNLLRDTAVTGVWNGYQNGSEHRKLTWRRNFSRRSCAGSIPGPLDYESDALTIELFPRPMGCEPLCGVALLQLQLLQLQ